MDMVRENGMPGPLNVGADTRLYCTGCMTEYQVTHEPMYVDPDMKKGFGGKAKTPKFCPFCGFDDDVEETA